MSGSNKKAIFGTL